MVSGWADHPGGRHHGAHAGATTRSLGAPSGKFLDFSQNINPLGAPPAALDAAHRALEDETATYPDMDYPELREALAGYLGVPARTALPTNGGAEALFLAARMVAREKAGKALIPEPTFSEYAVAASAAGLEPVRRVARFPESGFRLDLSSLDLDGVALIFLCNPNNPTGEALLREEVLKLAERARAADVALVVDEAFADFAPEVSVAPEAGGELIVARSLTKFFAVPGLRLGCLISTETERLQALQPSWPVNSVAAAAGVAAVRDEEFVEATLAEVERLRAGLSSGLSALGLDVFPGAANFLLVRGPEGVAERLARRGVLVRGCEPFVGLSAEYFRVAVRRAGENEALIAALREEL